MKYIISLLVLVLVSCSKEDLSNGLCIDGPCSVQIFPDPVGQPNAYQDDNGYWHLEYTGAKYFQTVIKYSLTKLQGSARPNISTMYTTDTWMIAKDGYKFWSARYNPLGSEYTQNFRTAIADTMVVVSIPPSEIKEMTNVSGQYFRDCYNPGCGLGPEPVVYSSVPHKSKAQFIYMPEMARIKDTVTIDYITTFQSNKGMASPDYQEEVVESQIKVIL